MWSVVPLLIQDDFFVFCLSKVWLQNWISFNLFFDFVKLLEHSGKHFSSKFINFLSLFLLELFLTLSFLSFWDFNYMNICMIYISHKYLILYFFFFTFSSIPEWIISIDLLFSFLWTPGSISVKIAVIVHNSYWFLSIKCPRNSIVHIESNQTKTSPKNGQTVAVLWGWCFYRGCKPTQSPPVTDLLLHFKIRIV
jgi:hypothetical protein